MPTIARMYGSQETATAVAKELQDGGFSAGSIHVFAGSESAGSITQAGISPAAAQIYADGISSRGEALVTVDPPFGYARAATDIMDSHNPIPVDVPAAAPAASPAWTAKAWGGPKASAGSTDWSGAAPLSAALGLRVLLSDPTPFSNWIGRPVLKTEPATSNTLESIRKQSDDPAPLSSKLGLPTLSDKPPSAQLLPDAAPLSAKLGWRTLSDDPAPLSAKLGWKTLLDNPAPLSTWLGLPVLSKR